MSTYYQQLAEIRYRIRLFVRFSEEVAREHGMEPQQHQLLLVIKGLPDGIRPTIRAIASRLCLRHNTTVELVSRLAEHGAVVRKHCENDRREVLVELTAHGEQLLESLSVLHYQELQTAGSALVESLQSILREAQPENTTCQQSTTQKN